MALASVVKPLAVNPLRPLRALREIIQPKWQLSLRDFAASREKTSLSGSPVFAPLAKPFAIFALKSQQFEYEYEYRSTEYEYDARKLPPRFFAIFRAAGLPITRFFESSLTC